MPRPGRTSPRRRNPRPTPRILRVWKANSRNIFLRLRGQETDPIRCLSALAAALFGLIQRQTANPNSFDIAETTLRSPRTGRKSLIFTENVLYWPYSSRTQPCAYLWPQGVPVKTSNRGVAVPRAGCVTENA